MSAETPAAHLARLRTQYGARWRIGRVSIETTSSPGYGRFVATRRGGAERLVADSLAELEAKLIALPRWGQR